MTISVKDIQEKEFTRLADGGYSAEQVDDFLDEIVDQFEAIIRENITLRTRVTEAETALAAKEQELGELTAKTPDYNEEGYFKNLQDAMRKSLISAQRVADETTAAAKDEASQLVEAAQAQAAKTVADAKAEAEEMTSSARSIAEATKAEYESLKAAVDAYRAGFRKLVEEQLEVLKANDLLLK